MTERATSAIGARELRVELVPSIAQIGLQRWNALVDPNRDSPFVDYRWLHALEATGCVGGASGWNPAHIAIFDGSDLVAAAPTYLKENSEGEFVYDFSWADFYRRMGVAYYPKLVTTVPFTPALGTRILAGPSVDAAAMRNLVARVLLKLEQDIPTSSAHLLFVPEDHLPEFEGDCFMERHGIQFHWNNRGFTSYDDFLLSLPSKRRTQIRREQKELRQQDVVVRTLDTSELASHVPHIFRFYASTVAKFPWQRRYLNEAFFAEVAQTMPEQLAWVVAEQNGKPIAGAFNVRSNTRLYGRYWGADLDLPFLHFDVCYYHGIQECIVRGLQVFEPGAGGEHKRSRGFEPTLTRSVHHLRDPKLRPVFEDFLRRERAAVAKEVGGPPIDENARAKEKRRLV